MKFFKSNNVNPKILTGTKWIAVDAALENKKAIEFVDKAYCIYTSLNKVELHTYKICGDQILINGLLSDSISYAIKGNTFFQNDTPLYIKE